MTNQKTGQSGPAEQAQPDDLTLELNSVFIGITRATGKRGEAFAKGQGLTPARVAVLSILQRNSGQQMTVGEIAAGLHVSSTNISRRLDGMEQEGWIERVRNPGDGRSIYVQITDAGREKAGSALPGIYRRLDTVWSCFTPEEKKELLRYFNRLLEHVQASPLLGQPGSK